MLKNNIWISYTKNKYLVNKPKIHQRNKWNLSFCCYLVLRILCGLRTAYNIFSSTHFQQMFTFYTLWKHWYGNISQERVKESNFQNSWLNYRWTINYALNWDMYTRPSSFANHVSMVEKVLFFSLRSQTIYNYSFIGHATRTYNTRTILGCDLAVLRATQINNLALNFRIHLAT